jgi:hypothetical protein
MYNVETLRSRAGEKEFTAGQTLMRRMLARESRRTKEECTYLVAGESRHQVKVTAGGAACDCGQRYCRHAVASILLAVESGAMQEMENHRAYVSAPALMDAVAGMLPESDGVKLVPVLFLCQDGIRIALRVGEDRLYVVRSVPRFLQCRAEGTDLPFGKGFLSPRTDGELLHQPLRLFPFSVGTENFQGNTEYSSYSIFRQDSANTLQYQQEKTNARKPR